MRMGVEQKIVEATPDAVVFADADGVIRTWNAGAERTFGHSAQEAIGQTLDLIVPERFRDAHWNGFKGVVASGETKYGAELLTAASTKKDGTRIIIEMSIALVKEDGQAVSGIAAIVRDIT